MNVWNEVKRIYEIQEELNNIPLVQVYKGSRQRRWLLESEKTHLMLSVETEISMETNWFKKQLLNVAMWGVSQPEIIRAVNKSIKPVMTPERISDEEHKAEIGRELLEELQSRVDKD